MVVAAAAMATVVMPTAPVMPATPASSMMSTVMVMMVVMMLQARCVIRPGGAVVGVIVGIAVVGVVGIRVIVGVVIGRIMMSTTRQQNRSCKSANEQKTFHGSSTEALGRPTTELYANPGRKTTAGNRTWKMSPFSFRATSTQLCCR